MGLFDEFCVAPVGDDTEELFRLRVFFEDPDDFVVGENQIDERRSLGDGLNVFVAVSFGSADKAAVNDLILVESDAVIHIGDDDGNRGDQKGEGEQHDAENRDTASHEKQEHNVKNHIENKHGKILFRHTNGGVGLLAAHGTAILSIIVMICC